MAEYFEYMWDPTRGHVSNALARSIYNEEVKFDVRNKKLAIKTVRAILREMPGIDLKQCTDEYITRFLLARKYRTEQAAALIAAYQAQIAHRQDIFGNLTARDPRLQRALRAGIPGVLPARDKKGRCVLVILASQWDPIAVPALSVQRAIFLVLETLIQDPRNQQYGFVAVVDWGGFSLRQGGALGAGALRNLIAALRGRFPARFKAVHFLSAPLCVQATLALVKPFLDEKTRHKIYLHGNNLSTLHEHLPTDILPAELGGTGPAFNPGLWAEPVIHSAMKEAELAAIKRDRELAERAINAQNKREARNKEKQKNHNQSQIEEISQRTPGNGEAAIDDEKTNCLENLSSPSTEKCEDHSEINKIEKMPRISRDSERPDGRESVTENTSSNADSPLITAGNNEKTENLEELDELNANKDDEYFSRNAKENKKIFDKNTRIEDNRRDENVNDKQDSCKDNREADERTRFRVYKDDEESTNEKSTKNITTIENTGINNEVEDFEGTESETNSNEFEMISSQPDSDYENSMEILRDGKIATTKNGRNRSLPEEANLIT